MSSWSIVNTISYLAVVQPAQRKRYAVCRSTATAIAMDVDVDIDVALQKHKYGKLSDSEDHNNKYSSLESSSYTEDNKTVSYSLHSRESKQLIEPGICLILIRCQRNNSSQIFSLRIKLHSSLFLSL